MIEKRSTVPDCKNPVKGYREETQEKTYIFIQSHMQEINSNYLCYPYSEKSLCFVSLKELKEFISEGCNLIPQQISDTTNQKICKTYEERGGESGVGCGYHSENMFHYPVQEELHEKQFLKKSIDYN